MSIENNVTTKPMGLENGEAENSSKKPEKVVGRNEPCPCGSGKKYKRCHGVAAEGIIAKPVAPQASGPSAGVAAGQVAGQAGSPFAGFDPSQMDPQVMGDLMKHFQRLPKGQLQRLQSLMQKAMAGKDVTSEAKILEQALPPELQQKLFQVQGDWMAKQGANVDGAAAATPANQEMSLEEAKRIVEQAAKEGKISTEKASELVENVDESKALEKNSTSQEKKSVWNRLFKK